VTKDADSDDNEAAKLRERGIPEDKTPIGPAVTMKVGGWTLVGEGLPEKETTEQWEMYLCKLYRYGQELIAPLSFIGGSWYSESHSCYDEFVIAWKPLPVE
jgi:hypothetical protein